MASQSTPRAAKEHFENAWRFGREWLERRASLQKQKAKGMTSLVIGGLVLGLFVLIWGEIAAFLALATQLEPYIAAVLLLVANGLVIAALGVGAKLKERGALRSNEVQRIEESKAAARYELVAARSELIEAGHRLVQSKFLEPYEKYKRPTAVATTFLIGVFAARALVSERRR